MLVYVVFLSTCFIVYCWWLENPGAQESLTIHVHGKFSLVVKRCSQRLLPTQLSARRSSTVQPAGWCWVSLWWCPSGLCDSMTLLSTGVGPNWFPIKLVGLNDGFIYIYQIPWSLIILFWDQRLLFWIFGDLPGIIKIKVFYNKPVVHNHGHGTWFSWKKPLEHTCGISNPWEVDSQCFWSSSRDLIDLCAAWVTNSGTYPFIILTDGIWFNDGILGTLVSEARAVPNHWGQWPGQRHRDPLHAVPGVLQPSLVVVGKVSFFFGGLAYGYPMAGTTRCILYLP